MNTQKMFARVGVGGFLDRINKINRIMRVRVSNYLS